MIKGGRRAEKPEKDRSNFELLKANAKKSANTVCVSLVIVMFGSVFLAKSGYVSEPLLTPLSILGMVAFVLVIVLSLLQIPVLLAARAAKSKSLKDFLTVEVPKDNPVAIQTRKDIDIPEWVTMAMTGRYLLLFFAAVSYGVTEQYLVPAILVASFFGASHLVYRVYRKQDPVSAEVVFYNEEDGYHSGGNDDGDGGD